MTPRRATVADLPRIERCAAEFYASSQFLKGFDLERFCKLWTGLIESGAGVIFFFPDESGEWAGMIGGLSYPDIYSGALTATEMFWFVRKEHRGSQGIRLYQAFEAWAREQGCSVIRMVHLLDSMPEKLEKLYRRMGYVPAEVHYTKELT